MSDCGIRDFAVFADAKVVSDDQKAPGIEIGRPNDLYRRVRIDPNFGKIAVLVCGSRPPRVRR